MSSMCHVMSASVLKMAARMHWLIEHLGCNLDSGGGHIRDGTLCLPKIKSKICHTLWLVLRSGYRSRPLDHCSGFGTSARSCSLQYCTEYWRMEAPAIQAARQSTSQLAFRVRSTWAAWTAVTLS